MLRPSIVRSSFVRAFTRFASTVTGKAAVYSSSGRASDHLKVFAFKLSAEPKPDEILVKLVAAPVNPADINQIEGVYPSYPPMECILGSTDKIAVAGNEGLFEVIATGCNVKNLKAGDWAIPSTPNFGTWRTHVMTESSKLTKIPRGTVAPLVAATVSVNPTTAYYMLKQFVNLEKGDWVIQNGGTSNVGRAVMQLAKLWGIHCISIVRDREDIEEVRQELLDLGSARVFTESEANDRKTWYDLEHETDKRRFKLGLNCVGGTSCTNVARHLGPDGHLVTYGGMSRQPVTLSTSSFIFKNLTAHGYWLTAQTKKDPETKNKMVLELLDMFAKKQLQPASMNVHRLSETCEDVEFLDAFKRAITTQGKKQVILIGDKN